MIILAVFLSVLAGGLINALADHLPVDRKAVRPYCVHCGAPRRQVAWLGISAAVLNENECRYCGATRGIRPVVVELVSAGVGAGLYVFSPDWKTLLSSSLIFFIFLLITVIDMEHRLILHMVTGPAAVVMAILGTLGWIDPNRGVFSTVIGGVVGFGSVYLLYLLGIIFSKGMAKRRGEEMDEVAFGFGDVTLSGVIGLIVGMPGVLIAVFLGIMAAGIFSLGYIVFTLIKGKYTAFMPIPYGPFLIMGAIFVYLRWIFPGF